jgi:hypothetical protein
VGLLLFHPGAARIDCEECKRFIFDLKTGERNTYRAGPGREELPCVRPVAVPTPCGTCPKKSPASARELELSRRNVKTLWIYRQVRATAGQCLTDEMRRDGLLMRNLALLDGIFRDYDQSRLGEQVIEFMLLARR